MSDKDQLLATYHQQFNQMMDELREKLEKIEGFLAQISEMHGIASDSHTTLINKLQVVTEDSKKASQDKNRSPESRQDSQKEEKVFSSLIDKEEK